MHHVENNMEEDTSSTLKYQRDRFTDWLQYFLKFLLIGVVDTFLYLFHRKKKKIYLRFTFGELTYYAFCVVMCFVNFTAALMIFIIPVIYSRFISMLGNVQALLTGVGIVAGVTLVLVMSNTLAMGARERRTENSLLRVLGFSRTRICGLLLLESAFYGLAGGVLGIAGAAGLLQLLIGGLEGTTIAQVIALLRLDAGVGALALGVSALLSLVAGAYPAIAAGSGSLASQLRNLS